MDKKRYQVFVSSTFTDLKEERQLVIRTLMEIDCIPAGMELFPAADEEQFEFIKKVIDDCDYYVVIVGGRYGSVSKEGISYTEMEYEYAKKIGLKVLAFLHEDPAQIPAGKSELDPEVRQKLEGFRNKLKENRLVSFWKDTNDLDRQVMKGVSKTIKMFPAIGWIRGSFVDTSTLLQQINDIRTENEELKRKLEERSGDRILHKLFENGKTRFPLLVMVRSEPMSRPDRVYTADELKVMAATEKTYTIMSSWNDIFEVVAINTIVPTEEETIASQIIWTVEDGSVSEERRRRYESKRNEIVSVVLKNSGEVMRALCLQNLVEAKDAPAAFALRESAAGKHWQITDTGKEFYAFITSNKKSIGVAWGSHFQIT